MDRLRQPAAPEVGIERGIFRPRVEANANLALAVVQTARDEVALVGDDLDLIAVGGLPLDNRDRSGVEDLDGARRQLLHRADVELGHVLFEFEVARGPGPLFRQRRSPGLVQGELEGREAEQHALQADGRQRDADLVQ